MHVQQHQQHRHSKNKRKNSSVTIFDIKSYFESISLGQIILLSQVKRVMQLILVMPAANASPERSFSALIRVKTYLRSTMNQDRLNYLMLLHVHKGMTDGLHIQHILNEFAVGDSVHSRIIIC